MAAGRRCRLDTLVQFLKTDISLGSVATRFRCGGMFNDHFILHLLLNVAVKKIGQ